MQPRDIFFEQIRHHETNPTPYTLYFEDEVGTRLDQHYGSQEWRWKWVQYAACHFGITQIPSEKMDDQHTRDAFGSIWRNDGQTPAVVEPGLKEPSFRGYTFPAPGVFLNPTAKAEIAKRIAQPSEKFRILFQSVTLWDSWNLRGFENTLMDCAAEEDFYAELIERMTDLCLALLKEFADIPADAIMLGDDWGDQRGILIGPERWRKFFKPAYARIFEAIHAQGKVAILHSCGSVADILPDIVDIGLDVLESVQPEAVGMNPYALKKAWGDKITFWGGLGTQQTIRFGTPTEIRDEIRHLRREMYKGGGYIMAPAKALRPDTPTENAVAVVEEFLNG
jgi:uroporphyrinogen decarboxylase